MIRSPFTPVTKCPVNSTAVSSTITIASADNGKSLTVQGGSAVVNGVTVATPVTLHTGDTLAISTTTSATNNTATFVKATFGSNSYYVTFVTVAADSSYFDTGMYAVPFFNRTAPTGAPYNSTAHTYSVAVNGSVTEKVIRGNESGVDNTLYQIMILDPYNKQAHRVGSDGTLVASYTIPDASWSGASVFASGKFTFWFGMFNQNQIGITLDGLMYTYLPMDSSPIAIATNQYGMNVWVATSGKYLYCLQSAGGLNYTTAATIQLANAATSIAMDDAGNCYVVSMNGTTVTKYSNTGTNLGSCNVGNMPTGIAYVGGQVFVSCAEDKTIIAVNTTTMTQSGTISINGFPGLLSIDPTNNNLCVTCLSSPNVFRYKTDPSLSLVDTTVFGKNVLTAYSFGNNIIADHLQYDARSYTLQLNSLVPGLGFFEHDEAPINTVFNSTTVTAIRLAVTVPIAIPTGLGASIVLNGSNIGTSGTIKANDTFYITFTTPSTASTLTEIPVSVGNYVEPFTTITSAIATQPNSFYFNPQSAPANTLRSSNIVTLSGITLGTTLSASCDTGTLLKNGIAQSGTFSVTNGDTLQAQLTSSASNGVAMMTATVGTLKVAFVLVVGASINTTLDTHTGVAVNTSVTSVNMAYTGSGSNKLYFPAGITVKANGVAITNGQSVTRPAQISITGLSSTQLGNTTNWPVTSDDGTQFVLQIKTIDRVVPYPADFGVIYDAAPGIQYATQNVTLQSMTAATSMEIQHAGWIRLNDFDTKQNPLVGVQNGNIIGLNIRGQITPNYQMVTIPAYVLDTDGVTWDQFGTVRVIPMILNGSVDYPYYTHPIQNAVQFFRYKPGVYSPVDMPLPTDATTHIVGTVTLPSFRLYTFSQIDTSYAYTTVPVIDFYKESSYTYVPVNSIITGYHETSYAQTFYFAKDGTSAPANPSYAGFTYNTVVQTARGIANVAIAQYASANNVPPKPQPYYYNAGALFGLKPVRNTYGSQGLWKANYVGNISNMQGLFKMTTLDHVLHGMWVTDAPIPTRINNTVAVFQNNGSFGFGCTKAFANMPTNIIDRHDPGTGQHIPPVPQFFNHYEGQFQNNGTDVEIVQMIPVDLPQPIMYEDGYTRPIQEPTLYGGFDTQADAQQFVIDNSLTNAHAVELSNGYWIVVSDPAAQDLVCAINPSTGIRAIAWLLGGG